MSWCRCCQSTPIWSVQGASDGHPFFHGLGVVLFSLRIDDDLTGWRQTNWREGSLTGKLRSWASRTRQWCGKYEKHDFPEIGFKFSFSVWSVFEKQVLSLENELSACQQSLKQLKLFKVKSSMWRDRNGSSCWFLSAKWISRETRVASPFIAGARRD